MRYGRLLFGVMLALLLVGVVAGVGLTAYNAGVKQGVVESGLLVPPTTGGVAPNAPFYGPWAFNGFHRPSGFGFGFLGCLVPLFFIILLFAFFRLAFRPRWGHGGWNRGGWDPSQGDIPPRVQEWHRKLHEQENQTPQNPTPPQAA